MPDAKVLSSKTVFQSKYFQVNQVIVERGGKTFTKEIIERTPFVAILPYTDTNEIYLESQYRDAFGRVLLEVVGGKIHNNEDPLVTAKRELLEEAGLIAKRWQQIGTWETSSNMREAISVFVATDLEKGEQKLDDDEEIEVIKMSLPDALKKIEEGEIVVSSDIAAILLFDKLKKEGKL